MKELVTTRRLVCQPRTHSAKRLLLGERRKLTDLVAAISRLEME